MTTFQIALALVGVLVLAGVVVHGAWQTRRSEIKRVADAPAAPPAAQEPSFDAPAASERADGAASAPRIEPTLMPQRRASARVDALIDAIATLTLDSPASGDTAIAHLPPSRRAGSKPFLIEGLNAETGEWEAPVAGQRYGEFQAGLLLANRGGALNEIEYSEFVQKVQAFADALGALPDFPDMLDVVGRARELDAFAGQHDAQLALRLVSRGAAWSPGYVQQHAARHGFVAGGLAGRLALPGREEGAPPVLSLQFDAQAALADDPNQSALREITLAFDVPQSAAAETPFATWCSRGQALAQALDAALYDDSGQPFQASAFAAIEQELERLYTALAERDLAAGSGAARRLFS